MIPDHSLAHKFVKHAEQPFETSWTLTDDVFVKLYIVPRADTFMPQHAHVYEHGTLLAHGRVRVWEDDVYMGEHAAPTMLTIKAGVKHTFQTLVDGTVLACIHNTSRQEIVEILAENHLVEGS